MRPLNDLGMARSTPQLFIPSNLAYKQAGRPGIPPNSVLIFEIELIEIVK